MEIWKLQAKLIEIFGEDWSIGNCDYDCAWKINAKLNNKKYTWVIDKAKIDKEKRIALDFGKGLSLLIVFD